MLNRTVLTVIKRELKEKMMSKSFIIMTLLLPLLMFGLIGFQTFLYQIKSSETIEIVSSVSEITQSLKQEFAENGNDYELNFNTITEKAFPEYLETRKKAITDKELTGILFIPESALEDKKIEYYSASAKNLSIAGSLEKGINKTLLQIYFIKSGLSEEDIQFARKGISFKDFKITKNDSVEEQGYGNLIVAYIFTFLLYMSLLMMGSSTMQSVIEEKNNRIVEMILSSISAREFMMSKILGAALTGLAQMIIWISPVFIVASSTLLLIPPEFTVDLSGIYFVYFLINFFIGLLLFIGLFATVGSIFETAQEAQSGLWPVMLLIIIPFFIGISMINNPSNPIAFAASLVPFSSVIVMPVRISIADVHAVEIIIALLLNLAALILIFPLAGKIYQIGILRTGKKPTLKDLKKWLKMN